MTTNAILTTEKLTPSLEAMPTSQANLPLRPSTADASEDAQRWKAVLEHNCGRDGEFVYAVSTTGVYCRPSCPSRRPRREKVEFFPLPEQAEHAGYRACLRCRPKSVTGNPQADGVKAICRLHRAASR